MITVLILRGKGASYATFVEIRHCESKTEAKLLVEELTDISGKYWTAARIIEDGEEIETHRDDFT